MLLNIDRNQSTNNLLGKLSVKGLYCLGYADDLPIVVRSKFARTLSEISHMALKIVENCCKDKKLSVNPNRTVVIPFTKKRVRRNNVY